MSKNVILKMSYSDSLCHGHVSAIFHDKLYSDP